LLATQRQGKALNLKNKINDHTKSSKSKQPKRYSQYKTAQEQKSNELRFSSGKISSIQLPKIRSLRKKISFRTPMTKATQSFETTQYKKKAAIQ